MVHTLFNDLSKENQYLVLHGLNTLPYATEFILKTIINVNPNICNNGDKLFINNMDDYCQLIAKLMGNKHKSILISYLK